MVRVNCQNGDGGGSWVGDLKNAENGDPKSEIGMGQEIPGNSGFM